MALVKLKDFYPDYKHNTPNAGSAGVDFDDLKKFDVYARNDDKVGSVDDVLVDDHDGRFRYYVVDTGFWIFGKKVLVPVGLARVDSTDRRIEINQFTKEQVEDLPNFDDLEKIDFEHEEQVRNVYRPTATKGAPTAAYDRNTYQYDQDANLYGLNDRDHQTIKLYEERLIANKQRRKVGEVEVGKHVETETTRVSVPVEKERVVIERTAPTNQRAVDPKSADFHEGEVARMEVYEERPDIHKEAFVREEVNVRKVTERDQVQAEEKVRREELDIDTQGRPIIDK